MLLRQSLLVDRNEIDGVEQQRGKSAISHSRRDYFASKWKQQPGAFDHKHRLEVFGRNILKPEYACECQLKCK